MYIQDSGGDRMNLGYMCEICGVTSVTNTDSNSVHISATDDRHAVTRVSYTQSRLQPEELSFKPK